MQKKPLLLSVSLITLACLSRLLPHPPNFTPVMAIALFGGFYFTSRLQGLLVPGIAMFLSDLFLGFHSLMPAVYFSFFITYLWGSYGRSYKTPLTVFLGALGGSLFFFLFTNLAVWFQSSYYPNTWQGLMSCYVLALPFFKNSLAGDLFYTIALFGSYELVQRYAKSSFVTISNSID